jgi:hypothetical protein
MVTKPLGFGDTKQTAEFFGLPQKEILRKAQNGEWPSWVISGRRVFDLDAIVKTLAKPPAEPRP